MNPSVGRIVHYKISKGQALEAFNMKSEHQGLHSNPLSEGEVYPMLITKVWDKEPTEISVVQGQVFIDGNFSLWVSSAKQGTEINQWHDPRGE